MTDWRRQLRRSARRTRRLVRRYRWAFFGLAILFALSGIYVGVRAALVVVDLQAARADVTRLSATALDRITPQTASTIEQRVQRRASSASGAVDDPIWTVWSHFPFVGRSLTTLRGITHATDAVANKVLPPVVELSAQARGIRSADGNVDTARLAAAATTLSAARRGLDRAAADLTGLPDTFLPPLDHVRDDLQRRVAGLHQPLAGLEAVTRVGPAMLGANGPRHYLLAVLNLAESRASGGIVGAYAVLTADHGHLTLDHVASDTTLLPTATAVADDLPAWYKQRYDPYDARRDWREVTLTPDFPSAAHVMAAMWEQVHPAGTPADLDGVIAVDPVTLADLLAVTGPMTTSDGHRLTKDNAVAFVLRDAYAIYQSKEDRSAALTETAKLVFRAVTSGGANTVRLAAALAHATSDQHLQVFSTHPDEEAVLRGTQIAGELPDGAAPFLEVVTQDFGGDKLSYYLRREVTYQGRLSDALVDQGNGYQAVEDATLTVTLTNTAPASGLPEYVTTRPDLPPGTSVPVGQLLSQLEIYLGPGTTVSSATKDGKRVDFSGALENELTVLATRYTLDPGQSTTFVLHLSQPTIPGVPLTYRQQPLVTPDTVHITQVADGRRLAS